MKKKRYKKTHEEMCSDTATLKIANSDLKIKILKLPEKWNYAMRKMKTENEKEKVHGHAIV